MSIQDLQQREIILAGNYWENFKFIKDIAQMMGGNHSRVKQLNKELDIIRNEWHKVKEELNGLVPDGVDGRLS